MVKNIEHILTVEVQKENDVLHFIWHYKKKVTAFKAKSFYEGFEKIQRLIEAKDKE